MSNLVGTGLNQVPTNGMLGGLAYQSPNSASIKDLDLRDLSKIKSEIADTAVDVFVYDTSKDSDGGAWRKRTKDTSWYNETLNTATRGSRREFPAVAVIVAESSKVTIYDGDDPDMPMWMEFISTSGQYGALYDGRTVVSFTAKNGIIVLLDSVDSILNWNFVADKIITTATSSGRWSSNRTIEDRNPTDGVDGWTNLDSSKTLVGYPLTDLAVTVLPNAPIDDVTGLPVLTTAVSTAAGVSIIKNDETVVDITPETSYPTTKKFNSVDFTKDHNLILTDGQTADGFSNLIYLALYKDVPNSDLTDEYSDIPDSISYVWNGDIETEGEVDAGAWKPSSTQDEWEILKTASDYFAVANVDTSTTPGITRIGTYPNHLLTNRTTTDYNTGWTFGFNEATFLSDTSTTNRDADTENLITGQKHDYESNTTESWSSQSNASATYDASNGVGGSACIRLTASGASNVWNSITFSGLTANTNYTLRFSAKNAATAGTNTPVSVSSGAYNTGTVFLSTTYTNTAQNTYEYVILPFNSGSFTEVRLNFYANSGTGANLYLDEFYLTEAEADRSINEDNLSVFGSITKSAVATGADLVAYSGWSNTNFLAQPYNADMNFGTGDFCVMGWIYTSSFPVTSSVIVSQHNGVDNSGNRWSLYVLSSGLLGFYQNDGSSDTNTVDGPQTAAGVWQHVTAVRRGSANQVVFYLNGERLARTGTSRDVDNTGNITTVGVDHTFGSAAVNTSISLLRITKTEPSQKQVKKIYDDEKHLFQENAKATLYGSSDTATALGYDDDEETLYVGTSSGRSDFRGLRRINNTTTAVTTAISASNGLVAEQ